METFLTGYNNDTEKKTSVFARETKIKNRTSIRNTFILGGNMLRHVKGKNMTNKLIKQKVYVKSYGGAKVGDMKHHAIPNME